MGAGKPDQAVPCWAQQFPAGWEEASGSDAGARFQACSGLRVDLLTQHQSSVVAGLRGAGARQGGWGEDGCRAARARRRYRTAGLHLGASCTAAACEDERSLYLLLAVRRFKHF